MKKQCYFADCQRMSVFGAQEIIGRMACSHHAAMGMTSRKTPDFRCFMFGCRNFGWLGIQGKHALGGASGTLFVFALGLRAVFWCSICGST
jgi:hypothetical protein